jgi:hypothetical protein
MKIASIKSLSLVSFITFPLLCSSVPSAAQGPGCRFLLDNCGAQDPPAQTTDESDIFFNGLPFVQSTTMGVFRTVYRLDGIVTFEQLAGSPPSSPFQYNWTKIPSGFCMGDRPGTSNWNCYILRKLSASKWEVLLLDSSGRIFPGPANAGVWTRP